MFWNTKNKSSKKTVQAVPPPEPGLICFSAGRIAFAIMSSLYTTRRLARLFRYCTQLNLNKWAVSAPFSIQFDFSRGHVYQMDSRLIWSCLISSSISFSWPTHLSLFFFTLFHSSSLWFYVIVTYICILGSMSTPSLIKFRSPSRRTLFSAKLFQLEQAAEVNNNAILPSAEWFWSSSASSSALFKPYVLA